MRCAGRLVSALIVVVAAAVGLTPAGTAAIAAPVGGSGLQPPVPLSPDTTPPALGSGGRSLSGCSPHGPYGFIRTTSAGVRLNVRLSTTAGRRVRAEFRVTDLSDSGRLVAAPASKPRTTAGDVSTAIGVRLRDGHMYAWQARTASSDAASRWSGTCYFDVDTSAPTALAVTSASFPPGGSTIVNVAGSMEFTAIDPEPAGCKPHACVASGVAYFEYSLDAAIPASGRLPGAAIQGTVPASAAPAGHPAAGTLTGLIIPTYGPHVLYVEAVDQAGNRSKERQYSFFVPDGWTSSLHFPMPGDVNGDDVPDLLATTSSGGLDLYPGSTTSTALPAPVDATANDASPDSGNDWNQFLITHRDSPTQGPDDDLYAQSGANLYLYVNNEASPGTAPQFGNTADVTLTFRPPCSATADNPANCTGYGSTWNAVSQLLAVGDPFPGAPVADPLGCLLTVEDGQLWLFREQGGGSVASPVQLGQSGWSGMTLIAPGFIDGQLTLWVRDNASGQLYSFPILIDANGLPTLNAAHPGRPVTPAQGTPIPGISLPASQYPTLASSGDPVGLPSLVVVGASGKVWLYPGTLGGLSRTPTQIGTVTAGEIVQLS